MANYAARITRENASGLFYALVVRVEANGTEVVLRGYYGRHFKTLKGAQRSTAAFIAKVEAEVAGEPPRTRLVRNALTGKMVEEPVDTPWAASVASEAYWSA